MGEVTKSAEKVWEGRGDGLANARFSIFDGRAAEDVRLTLAHLRILIHVGRQNASRGWLRLSQTEIAQSLGLARQTICAAVRDLVQWRYLEKRAQADTHESWCHYRILIACDDDRARADDDPDAAASGGVSADDDTPGVSHGRHSRRPSPTRVSAQGDTPRNAVYMNARAFRHNPTNTDSPPTPSDHGSASNEGGRGRMIDDLLAGVPDEAGHVRLYLAQIASVVRIDHPHPRLLLAEIAKALRQEPEPVLEELAAEIIRTRKKIVSAKCVLDGLKAAIGRVPVLTIREEHPAFAAWCEHFRDKPALVRLARAGHGFTVRSHWPPGMAPRVERGVAA